MEGASVFRRAFHIASPIFLGYYLLPVDLGLNVTRTNVTLLFLGTAWCIELTRIALGIPLFGMRPYEGNRVSAYAQGSMGLAFGIFVIRDPNIVVPVFIAMAWIDPLAALARRRKWSIAPVFVAYVALFLGTTTAMGAYLLPARILMAVVAATLALAVEGPRLPQIDDDLLMQVVPMVTLYFLVAGLAPAGLPLAEISL
ncbi:MAG TPA: hypothetical protein VJ300_05090 [Thermoplasmata archaeon]|nr:hypothetical protein [Thermoplasmata archaeon]